MDIRAEQLGLVAGLMYQTPSYCSYPVACLKAWIEPVINHRQIWFAFDSQGRAVAYFTWAWLAPDVAHRLEHDPNVLLHYSEWNEGEQLWIMDLVAPYGHAQDVMRYLRDHKFAAQREIRWLRRDEKGAVRHVTIFDRQRHRPPEKAVPHDAHFRLPLSAFAESQRGWLATETEFPS